MLQHLLLTSLLTASTFLIPLTNTHPFLDQQNITSTPTNSTSGANAPGGLTWYSFEDTIKTGLFDLEQAGYSILDIIATPHESKASSPRDLERITIRMLDPKGRRLAIGQTDHGYRWHTLPLQRYIPEAYEVPTWYWERERYTLKQAFKLLRGVGVDDGFVEMKMALTSDDPVARWRYEQRVYQFRVGDLSDPERYFGVGATNGVVFENWDGGFKTLRQPNLNDGVGSKGGNVSEV